jgi:hypothetical protein
LNGLDEKVRMLSGWNASRDRANVLVASILGCFKVTC